MTNRRELIALLAAVAATGMAPTDGLAKLREHLHRIAAELSHRVCNPPYMRHDDGRLERMSTADDEAALRVAHVMLKDLEGHD